MGGKRGQGAREGKEEGGKNERIDGKGMWEPGRGKRGEGEREAREGVGEVILGGSQKIPIRSIIFYGLHLYHRRRMETEAKAYFVASVWGAKFHSWASLLLKVTSVKR